MTQIEQIKSFLKSKLEILKPFGPFDNSEDAKAFIAYSNTLSFLESLEKEQESEIEKAYKHADEMQYKKGFEDGVAFVEKQKEQKLAETSNIDLDTKVNVWVGYTLNDNVQSYSRKDVQIMLDNCARYFYDYAIMCLDKPAEWSEEEKARIDRIVDVLDLAEEKGMITYSDWGEYVMYVRSLRPHIGLTPVQKTAISRAMFLAKEKGEESLANELNGILESANDKQSNWKPSEEQMVALEGCVDYLEESDNEDAEILESLLDDLKKL